MPFFPPISPRVHFWVARLVRVLYQVGYLSQIVDSISFYALCFVSRVCVSQRYFYILETFGVVSHFAQSFYNIIVLNLLIAPSTDMELLCSLIHPSLLYHLMVDFVCPLGCPLTTSSILLATEEVCALSSVRMFITCGPHCLYHLPLFMPTLPLLY